MAQYLWALRGGRGTKYTKNLKYVYRKRIKYKLAEVRGSLQIFFRFIAK
jgi:hypothetical protein